jgi:hypothetical protein
MELCLIDFYLATLAQQLYCLQNDSLGGLKSLQQLL